MRNLNPEGARAARPRVGKKNNRNSLASRQRSVLLIAFAFIVSIAIGRADINAQFDAANRLFEQGKFADAAASYETILKTGAVSPALYFNLGNARFKSGEIGKAIAAFRKAEQLAPRDPDLQANLRFVRNRVQGPTSPAAGLDRWLTRLRLNEWTWLAAVPFWTALLLLTAMQFRRNSRTSLGSLAALAGAASLVAGACLVFAWKIQTQPIAVVVAREAVVRNGPLEESQSAFTLRDGAEILVLDQKDGWLQIQVAKRIGWLKRDQVDLLSAKPAA